MEDEKLWVGVVGRGWQEIERSSWWSPEEMEGILRFDEEGMERVRRMEEYWKKELKKTSGGRGGRRRCFIRISFYLYSILF